MAKELRAILSSYPTKSDLKEILKEYPTKDDLKETLKEYATKDDVKDMLLDFADQTLLPSIETMFARFEARIVYEVKSYVDTRTADVLDRLDGKESRHKAFHTGVISVLENHTQITKKEALSLRESA